MSPSEFLAQAETTLQSIERAVENLADELDIDSERSGNVLTLTCENGSKIIINSQEAMQEIWLAAKAGGFHFRFVGSSLARQQKRRGTVSIAGALLVATDGCNSTALKQFVFNLFGFFRALTRCFRAT